MGTPNQSRGHGTPPAAGAHAPGSPVAPRGTLDWFEEWFGEEYLALYPHRDEEEAVEVAALIESRVSLPHGAPALDLACGAGRHMRALSDRWWTVGLDLSPALLRVARAEDPEAPLVRADMRILPFRDGAFRLVMNLFTSFGYFRDDTQHERVVAEVARVTARAGCFVLDFLNADQVRSALVARETRSLGSREVQVERAISDDGRFVRKTINLLDEGRLFTERVRLFDAAELAGMLERCRFRVCEILGDYDGSAHAPSSPRTILIGERQ